MRRLLMFLIEKLPKDTSQQDDGNKNANKKSKGENLNLLISNKINLMLSQCWTPSYCKQKSIRTITKLQEQKLLSQDLKSMEKKKVRFCNFLSK